MSLGSTLGDCSSRRASKATAPKNVYRRPSVGEKLTKRESQTYELMAQAFTQKEIATHLGLTHGSAKGLACKVLAKTGFHTVGQLIRHHQSVTREASTDEKVRMGTFE